MKNGNVTCGCLLSCLMWVVINISCNKQIPLYIMTFQVLTVLLSSRNYLQCCCCYSLVICINETREISLSHILLYNSFSCIAFSTHNDYIILNIFCCVQSWSLYSLILIVTNDHSLCLVKRIVNAMHLRNLPSILRYV